MDQTLLVAIKDGNLHTLRRLVAFYHVGSRLMHLKDTDNGTPIHLAIKNGDFPMLEYLLLIMRGHRINDRERACCGGFTALHYACLANRIDLIRALVLFNADLNVKSSGLTEETPLILCCKKGLLKAAAELVHLGANVHTKDGFGYTAAVWCRRYNREGFIVKLGLGPPTLPSFTEFVDLHKARNNGVFQIPKVKQKQSKKSKKTGASKK